MTDREQLRRHLEFFRELGVDGISLDARWRVRDSAEPGADPSQPEADPADHVTAPAEHLTDPAAGAAVPADGAAVPVDGAAIPADGAVVPADSAVVPAAVATAPVDLLTDPSAGAAVPPAGAAVPADSAFVPTAAATAPSNPGAAAPPATAAASRSAVPAPAPAVSAPPPAHPAPAPAVSSSSLQTLEAVREDLGECTRCKLHRGRTNLVFGVGSPTADLVFVGEAPGRDEDRQGIPFVGRAGQLLTRIIAAIGLSREEVYIANVIKCRPPDNRNPEPDEVAACQPFLFRQIDVIQPRVVVALGSFAIRTLLKTDGAISRLRGRAFDYRGAKLIPTFHPAYLLRSPERKRDVWEDMKRVRALLAEPESASAEQRGLL